MRKTMYERAGVAEPEPEAVEPEPLVKVMQQFEPEPEEILDEGDRAVVDAAVEAVEKTLGAFEKPGPPNATQELPDGSWPNTAQELIKGIEKTQWQVSPPQSARNRNYISKMVKAASQIHPPSLQARQKQTLEDHVFRVCRAADILGETMTVTEIAHTITTLRGVKTSTGAVNNVLMRWKSFAIAELGERPVRFMKFIK